MSAPTPKRTLPERIFGPFPTFLFYAGAGVLHLVRPSMYEQIMPPQLPAHRELVYASGIAEIVGGALFLNPKTRTLGAWYLVALLIAVFPANIYMASQEKFHRMVPGGQTSLLLRLPLQFVLMWWVVRLAKRTAPVGA